MHFLKGKTHDLGDKFFITRYLPDMDRRSIGPFIFFDFFGPLDFPPGKGIDVRPHPHIGLATVTYLFEGAQMHRDTLGTVQEINPGDVNWMTAGRGIAHSERTGAETRAAGHRMHGIQTWVGLPTADEEAEPRFQHFKSAELPVIQLEEVELKLMVGSAFGLTSPVKTFSPIFYADAKFAVGGVLTYTAEHDERGLLIIDGDIQIGGDILPPGTMLFLEKGEEIVMFAQGSARAVLFGGSALDGQRHLWWNFVSSSKERIEQAKRDWKDGKFGLIPGDDKEFIPLPEDKR
jgi:redox-sensitive bicupin YhaK (pirin superfamily)